MLRLKYDYNLLQTICNEGNVKLIDDYKDKYITRDTRIIGKCIMCENTFNKSLNNLHKNKNFGCITCSKIIKTKKICSSMLHKYGVEHAVHSEIFKNKMKETSLEKYGVEYPIQNETVKEQIRKTNLVKYGFEYGLQNETVKDKKVVTYLKNYGVENPLQCKEIMDKVKKTNMEKYGVEHTFQNLDVQKKIKQTNFDRYGFEYGFQNEEIKNKIKKTNLEKYGVEYGLQNKEIMDKIKKTNMEKYGVEHVTQNSEIMDKMTKCMYKSKEYIMPSGNIINIQGYEYIALDELLGVEKICENDIITGCKNVPTIWYIDYNEKKRRHFVDIFIPSQNRCIEVKSTWTAKLNSHTIFLKQKAAKELGYKYEIWIYDTNKTKVELYV